MKKPFITFLLVFAIAFGAVAWFNIEKINTNAAIAKSPVYVLATPEGITKKTKKGKVTYQVNFSYSDAGATYKKDSHWFDTVEQAEALASSPVQIAFATNKPADAVFKTEFDQRDPGEGMGSALTTAGMIGFFLALLGTAVLLYRVPSLRR
ncbi:DUF3592 domain-containing protein [Massilia sp. CCM 8695]|uniref:DUF3592 domain-containing protein n=1 Tax=Massilia frigida TaxID=2609281 RepID=A0ABX0N1I4_9BURK|nr:DUF3592 domain-containing protein [Massilia frigida]NHZ79156.1 DUF3592 domain-containing protein [Massilia frigida]